MQMNSKLQIDSTHSAIRPTHLALLSLTCLLSVAAAQQTKPNFSGSWKLDLSRSKVSAQHPHASDEYRIDHKEPRLTIVHISLGHSDTYRYVTDGNERVANSSEQDGVTQAKAQWDDNVLVIEKRQRFKGQDFSWTMTYAFSPDGKSLVIHEHVNTSSRGPAFDETLTYEKIK
jgi:hypothetical protein